MNIEAPWPDFKGQPITAGDHITHPDGDCGVVVFCPQFSTPSDQWWVDYGDGNMLRLCLQIGDKGQAVVSSKSSAISGHMSIDNYWKEMGDGFDGCVIMLSSQAFDTFHKVFSRLSRAQLESMGLTTEEIDIARSFAHLY